jgi:hypothetical protein
MPPAPPVINATLPSSENSFDGARCLNIVLLLSERPLRAVFATIGANPLFC